MGLRPDPPCYSGVVLSFETVLARVPWRPIPGCPGRYVLRGVRLGLDEVLGEPADVEEMGWGLSEEVSAAVARAVDLVVDTVAELRAGARALP